MEIQAFCPSTDFSKQTVISTTEDNRIHVRHYEGFEFTCTIEQLRELIAELTKVCDIGERNLSLKKGLQQKRVEPCTTKTR